MDTYQVDLFWAQTQDASGSNFQNGAKLIESIQLGLLLGGFLSFPFNPAFFISSRESLLLKEAGKACFRGNFFAFFLGILFFLFGSSSFLQCWYWIEPILSLLGLFLLFRYATALDASPKRFLGFISLQSSAPISPTLNNFSVNREALNGKKGPSGENTISRFTSKIPKLWNFFWFNFKPTSNLKGDTNSYFYLGVLVIWTNPFFWTPLGSFLYAIQFDDPLFRIFVVFSSLFSYICFTLFYFEFFTFVLNKLKIIQSPLFQGEVNNMSFVFDTFIACCLSLTIVLSVSHGSWREPISRYSDPTIDFKDWINKKLNKSNTLSFTSVEKTSTEGAEDQWLMPNIHSTFQYFAEYQSPTLKEPVRHYNRTRPWYNLPPLTTYQFEYAVKKYRLSTARLFGQNYLNWSNSFFLSKEKHFETNYSMSSFLKKFSTRTLHPSGAKVRSSVGNEKQIIQNNLKGYPHFSYARFVPLSEIESVKLRSEMNEYTKILQSF